MSVENYSRKCNTGVEGIFFLGLGNIPVTLAGLGGAEGSFILLGTDYDPLCGSLRSRTVVSR